MIRNLSKSLLNANKFLIQQKVSYNYNTETDYVKRQKEKEIADILKLELQATYVYIQDTTVGGSCGQMYKMIVSSPLFVERSKVEQHQMVTNALKEILKDVHGYNLKTMMPTQEQNTSQMNQEQQQQQQQQ